VTRGSTEFRGEGIKIILPTLFAPSLVVIYLIGTRNCGMLILGARKPSVHFEATLAAIVICAQV
jgi:hypothetical protein